MNKVILLLVVVGVAGGGATYYMKYVGREETTQYRTTEVARGDLVSTISATGTVEPVEGIDIGAQVVGRIKDLGIDPNALGGRKVGDLSPEERAKAKRVDYNSVVHVGTELASIDDTLYRAQLAQAQAAVRRAEADVNQFSAKVNQTQREWQRAQDLHQLRLGAGSGTPVKGISDADYDLAKANYEVALANKSVGDASIEQAKASLLLAQTNVDYCLIRSPVEGEIIERRVNIGQTVVSSLNAPSLFLIGKDLTRMQVWASVNEADIGRIRSRKDMPVTFTVDAYPERTFHGVVSQVRMGATMSQNVVTYTVVIDVDNADRALVPYLTANVRFEVEKRPGVLQVPNSALRWKPRAQLVAAEYRDAVPTFSPGGRGGRGGGEGGRGAEGGRPGRTAGKADPAAEEAKPPRGPRDAENRGKVWVVAEDGKHVRPIDVRVGQSDGNTTEIGGGDVKEGLSVVVGEIVASAGGDDGKNPFAITPFRRNGGSSKGP